MNLIIDLERPLEKILKKGKFLATKCYNTSGNNDSGSYGINPYYGRGTPEEWLVWKDKLHKALEGQCISKGPQRYMLTERVLTGDAKATCNQAALDIGIHTDDNFNKALMESTKPIFPVEALYKHN